MHGTRLYSIWKNMRTRCYNERSADYPRYGGRGVYVCEEWGDFEGFLAWAQTTGYENGLTLDRADNDGPYSPENCRWATRRSQVRNREVTPKVSLWGEERTVWEWLEDERVPVSDRELVATRVKRGWSLEKALLTPRRQNAAVA